MPYDENTNTHAMCDFYGHKWAKNDMMTARASKGYRIETCSRNGCDAGRRIWKG